MDEISFDDHEKGVLKKILKMLEGVRMVRDIQCFITGGFVRDKLLGVKSNDIDLCVGGVLLRELFEVFDAEGGEWDNLRYVPGEGRTMDLLMVFFGEERIDVTNFKLGDSAGIEGDARGRDFTVNALAYDIYNGIIVDGTGLGAQDVKDRILRTPLDVLETMTYSPIRIMRGLRLLSKYDGFRMHDTLQEFMQSDAAKNLLKNCLREGINSEFFKIFFYKNNIDSLRIILDSSLIEIILPQDFDRYKDHTDEILTRISSFLKLQFMFDLDEETVTSTYICIILSPIYHIRGALPLTKFEMREKWRFPKSTVDIIFSVFETLDNSNQLLVEFKQQGSVSLSNIGPLFYQHREKIVLASILLSITSSPYESLDFLQYIFTTYIEHPELYRISPHVKGSELKSEFKLSGKLISSTIADIINWQFQNPTSSREDCRQWLTQMLQIHKDPTE